MRRYRLAISVTLVLLVASAAVVGTWLWARHALGEGIARWRDEQIERGYTVDYQGPEFGGFPFALSVSFRTPRVTTPQGLTWQGPPVLGTAKLWDPFTIDLHFPGLHRLNASEEAIPAAADVELPRQADIAAEAAAGRVVLRRDGKVESASIDLASLVASGPKIETVTLQRLTARLGPLRPGDSGPSGDTLEQLDLVGEVLGVGLPAERGGLLGDRVDRLSFDSTLVGGIPPGKPETALPAWRERGGRWQFRRLAVLWGPLDLTADGVLTLDEAMRPAGEFETKMKGAGKIIDRLIATGEIKPEAAFAARLALAAMGRPDSVTGESVLAAPISLRQGMLYLGPIPLVPIAPVL
ncbi:DUF2125 domain-containing protein [Pelagibius sp. 7325]|uniref:DUF2125 domain-containing protein n=1 Tax=Pelagibius sp. 7325 TaxID=3131994 RepID=UPI0030EC8C4A